MMIIFIIEVASPYPKVAQKFLPNFDIRVVDEGSEVVDVIGWLVEILNGD